MEKSIQLYLDKKLDEHCKDHVETVMGLRPGDEDYKEEFESHRELMSMSLWRNSDIISTAYYMKIPKTILYQFGYTKEEINEEFTSEFGQDEYPY